MGSWLTGPRVMAGVGVPALLPAVPNPWRFEPHVDTWFVIGLSALGYWYAIARTGPTVVGRGLNVTRRQVLSFVLGLVALEIAADWPIHDLAESYLLSAHMIEHMTISLVAPPLLLLGLPDWLTRRVLRRRWAGGTVRVLGRPIVAGLVFSVVISISHAPFWVNATLNHHFLHFWAHVLLFAASMLMWFPVTNKLPEYPRLGGPGKMIYLFFQSIIPNVPAAFLILSTGVVYKFYATVPHPFVGLDAINDQQMAGAIMKVGGTFYIWGIIVVVFFRWAATELGSKQVATDRAASAAAGCSAILARSAGVGLAQPDLETVGSKVPDRSDLPPAPADDMPDVLTWEHVADELARTHPAEPG